MVKKKSCEELHSELEKLLVEYTYNEFKRGSFSNDSIKEVNELKIALSKKILNPFRELYYLSVKEKFSWQFCSLDVFKFHHEQRLSKFNKTYIDADYSSFLYEERRLVNDDLVWKFSKIMNRELKTRCIDLIDPGNYRDVPYEVSLRRILRKNNELYDVLLSSQIAKESFIKQLELDYFRESSKRKGGTDYVPDLSLKKQKSVSTNGLQWKGDKVELVEVIKALIELNKFGNDLTEKKIFELFSKFLNTPINEKKQLENIRNRASTGGDLDKFLIEMKDSLEQWNSRLNEKNRKNR